LKRNFVLKEIIMAMNSPFGDVAPPFWQGGPDPSGYYQFPHANRVNSSQAVAPNTRSQYPITVGTSVFGLKYKDGVIIAADTMGNYGRLSRYPNLQRVNKINETTVLASSGDIADFQYLHNIIESKQNEEDICGKGGVTMRPEALHCWLTRVLYNRRSKFDPLWNTIIVGGIQDGKPFLGCVDHIGTAWKENAVATGMGAAMAIPIIDHELEKYDNSTDNLNFEQARDIMMKCLRVSYLRDCRATNKFHISVVNKDGAKVEGPLTIDSNWEVAKMIKGYD
jgi:20S proteasome subunit beta 7